MSVKKFRPYKLKICTVCGLEKTACRAKLGVIKEWDRVDPRGFSSEAGMRTLPLDTLTAMARGRAGEGDSVVRLAKADLQRRRHNEGAAERCPLWALSPYERKLKENQQTVTGALPEADLFGERNMPAPSKPDCASTSEDVSPPITPPALTEGFCEDNPR